MNITKDVNINVRVSENNEHIVNARDLWEGLKSKQDFSNWIKNKLIPNFELNRDYTTIEYDLYGNIIPPHNSIEPSTQHVRVQKRDYPITLDTAKHLSLMENTERGKEVRDYFIKCEKELQEIEKAPQLPTDYKSALYALIEAEEVKERLALQIKEDAPKVDFATSIEVSSDTILIGDLATLITQAGFKIGQNTLFEYLRYEKYLCSSNGRYNLPQQTSIDKQLFEVDERTIKTKGGKNKILMTTRVTGKGQLFFINKFTEVKK